MEPDLQKELRAYLRRKAERGEPVPEIAETRDPLPPNPTSEAISDQLVRLAEPYVQDLRRDSFDAPSPPWDSVEDAGFTRWQARRFFEPTDADQRMDEGVQLISEGTGFPTFDVWGWILFGTRPSLSRVVIQTHGSKRILPDGTTLRREWATVAFNAPVQEPEMRRIWTRLNRVWTTPSGEDPVKRVLDTNARARKTPGIKRQEDRELVDWVERTPEEWTWEDRADAWAKDHKPVKANTLYRRYKRARKKLNSLSPQED